MNYLLFSNFDGPQIKNTDYSKRGIRQLSSSLHCLLVITNLSVLIR
jgi:hypothetical protein